MGLFGFGEITTKEGDIVTKKELLDIQNAYRFGDYLFDKMVNEGTSKIEAQKIVDNIIGDVIDIWPDIFEVGFTTWDISDLEKSFAGLLSNRKYIKVCSDCEVKEKDLDNNEVYNGIMFFIEYAKTVNPRDRKHLNKKYALEKYTAYKMQTDQNMIDAGYLQDEDGNWYKAK